MFPLFRLQAAHVGSRALHRYADWRIGATAQEKHCHKLTPSVLFTFDDYGTETEVADILAILARKHVKGMFFLIGDWAQTHPELVDDIATAGHVIGNHTFSHPNLLELSDGAVEQELRKGVPSRWVRAPQGRYNSRIRRIAVRLGLSLCYWTIDSRDWAGTDVRTMRHTILAELQPGATILFHIHGRHTRSLLPKIIDDIRSLGYIVTGPNETW
jgi:peptidoglycan/xylan/chitin deacetylase (PgdA/CDA1 family)